MLYEITIPGEPMAKGRPRYAAKGITYTPKKTVNYEVLVREIFSSKYGQPILKGDIAVTIKAYFAIPESKNNKVKNAMLNGKIRPTKKPDVDNISKIILDSLNKLAYYDDKQVIQAIIEKHYSHIPRVEVSIEEISVIEKAGEGYGRI